MEIGSINFRTYCHATESPEKVKHALGFLCGINDLDKPVEKKTYKFTTSKTSGHFGNPIVTYEIKLTKSKDIKQFWTRLNQQNPELVVKLGQELSARTDDDCIFHIRFDKQKAFQEQYELTVHGDCIVVKAKIRAYPAKRELAIKIMKRFFNDLKN